MHSPVSAAGQSLASYAKSTIKQIKRLVVLRNSSALVHGFSTPPVKESKMLAELAFNALHRIEGALPVSTIPLERMRGALLCTW